MRPRPRADGGVAYLLPRVVGMHKAKELVFFGDDLSAADAERSGSSTRSCPPPSCEAAPKEWAERLAGGPTKAIGWAKRLLHDASELSRENLLQEEAMYVELNSHTSDSGEGVASFRERCAPGMEGLVSRARAPSLIKDTTAVVGIGQTTLGKGLPDTELSLACQAISARPRRRRHRAVGGRRARVVHARAEPRGRRRPLGGPR